MQSTHIVSLDTDTRFLKEILLEASSNNPATWVKYQLDELAKTTRVVVECRTSISECFQDRVEL